MIGLSMSQPLRTRRELDPKLDALFREIEQQARARWLEDQRAYDQPLQGVIYP